VLGQGQRRSLAALLCGSLLAVAAVAAAQPGARFAGRPLAEALEELRAAGVDLIYSSQLVLPSMRVEREPAAGAAHEVLTAILAPHGLEARRVGASRFLIVQAAPESEASAAHAATPAVDARTLDEVLVHASRYALGREVASSVTRLDRQQLDSAPGAEQDAIRALQRIPGSANSGLSALSHVRGSYEDEVLIRFDGVRLYEPYHLKDFLTLFGAVDPELIDTVDAFSGGFPVAYGDRAGGVLDLTPRSTQGAEHLIGVSVFYNRAITSGSHSAGRGHWLAGYRRSNLAPVLRQIDRDVGEPVFEDLLMRYSYTFEGLPLTAAVGFLALEDDHELFTAQRDQQVTAGYSDDAAWLRLDYEQDSWSLGLHAAHTHLAAHRDGTMDRPGISSGTLFETRLSTLEDVRLHWTLRQSERLHWQGGFDVMRGEATYEYVANASFEPPLAGTFGRPASLAQAIVRHVDGDSYAPWISARADVGRTTVELGARHDERNWLGRGGQWSPRISARYDFDDDTVLRVSAGRFLQSQTLNELEVEESDPQFAAPESSRQVIVGVERNLPGDHRLRVELFDRHMRGVRPRFENVLDRLVLLPEIEVDRLRVAPLSSRSRGVEVLLQSDPRRELSWWASYTWSRSGDRFADGEAPRSWDQRNAAHGGVTWRREPWVASMVTGYVSGWPFTGLSFEGGPQGGADGFSEAVLGQRNRERFPNRYFVDLRLEYSLPLPRGKLEFLAEVRNAASHGNDCCREVGIEDLGGGAFAARVDQEKWITSLPIVGVNWRF